MIKLKKFDIVTLNEVKGPLKMSHNRMEDSFR